MSDKVECPICEQKYTPKDIDSHVNKCIFLNSSNESSSKRSTDSTGSPVSNKKIKTTYSDTSLQKSDIMESVAKSTSSTNSTIIGVEITGTSEVKKGCSIPLAELMRPSDLSGFVGQKHVLGPNKVLLNLIEGENIPSMILWGPPGCGKTTLAHIIAEKSKHCRNPCKFMKLSATMDGVKDVKEIVKIAKNEVSVLKRKTLLFMDEIHRFNKLQQDIFLPHVESGLITLIGATTENPSFSLNSALLSRCAVIVLDKLSSNDLYTVLHRAVDKLGGKIIKEGASEEDCYSKTEETRFMIDGASVRWLADMCDGDARIALNSLNIALQAIKCIGDLGSKNSSMLTLEHIKDGVKRSHLLYDKKGDEHYNTISALHKSIRAGDENAALYWLARMLEGGEDPLFVARRLVRAASEDIGLADPNALQLAVSAMQGCQLLGMPECDVLLTQCAVYLARAPKSREMDNAIAKAKECIRSHKGPLPPVPLHLRNAPTGLMKNLDYGKGYNMLPKEVSGLTYMPEGMEDINFF